MIFSGCWIVEHRALPGTSAQNPSRETPHHHTFLFRSAGAPDVPLVKKATNMKSFVRI